MSHTDDRGIERKTMEIKNQKQNIQNKEKNVTDDDSTINYRGWKVMPFIIGNETFEKLGTIGTLANLLIYLTTVFNLKNITATYIVNTFNGSTNFAPLFGAFLCDTYFGRYKTLGFATASSFLGLLVITLTAAIKNLHPPHCATESVTCQGPTAGQMAFLFTGFGFLVVGAAGIRPCNLAFGADQFNPNTESGKKGVNSFFNWYFFTFTFAMMVSLTLIVYIQTNVSWSVGLGIPAALMLISCVIYFMGSKKYVKIKATGSPVTSVVQVLVVAMKKRRLKLPENSSISFFNYMPPEAINTRLPYTPQFRFLNKAAIITPQDEINSDGSAANPWNLCSMQQVEEVKLLLRVIPIWASAIIYYLVVVVQQQTYSVFQAVQSDRTFGNTKFKIPAASYGIFAMLSLTIWLPIYDRLIVPSLQRVSKKEGGITILQRMGIGILLGAVSMIVAAVVEKHRRKLALTNPIGLVPRKGAISSMSAMWLVPQLAMAGLAEAFMSVGQVEFYYKQFPENMRSIGGSLLYCGCALSSYLSSFLISIIRHTTSNSETGNWLTEDLNKGRLEYFYFVIAALQVLNLGYFLLCSSWYRYKGSGSVSSIALEEESKQSAKTADVV